MTEDEIPDSSEAQATNLPSLEPGTEAKNFADRIARYGKAKARSVSMSDYLSSEVFPTLHPAKRQWFESVLCALSDCGSYLMFRDYESVGDIRLIRASFCQRHLLCPFCAIRRGAKLIQSYDAKYQQLIKNWPDPYLQLVTLTVKNGPDLSERFDHLTTSLRSLIAKRKKGIQRGSGGGEFANIRAGAYSIEFTNTGNGWHPHVHLVSLAFPGKEVNQGNLIDEWHQATGDSFIVDARPIDDPINGFMEVFKYALKFSDLPLDLNWQAFEILFGRRLIGAFGDFYGISPPDTLADDPLDDLPFRDRFFKYLGNSEYQEREI